MHAFLVHMYHEIAQPYALLHNLVPALKPGAHVGIVDAYGPTSEHGTPPGLLQCELAVVGYREISLDRLRGSDAYLAIFAPPLYCKPDAAGSYGRVQGAITQLPTHRTTARDIGALASISLL